jgi:hypothetical protein
MSGGAQEAPSRFMTDFVARRNGGNVPHRVTQRPPITATAKGVDEAEHPQPALPCALRPEALSAARFWLAAYPQPRTVELKAIPANHEVGAGYLRHGVLCGESLVGSRHQLLTTLAI